MLLCTAATCPALAFPYSLQRPRIRLALLIAPVTPQPSQELRWSWCQLPAVVLPWLRPPWHLCQPRQMRKQKMETVCGMIVCVCVWWTNHIYSLTIHHCYFSLCLCLSLSFSLALTFVFLWHCSCECVCVLFLFVYFNYVVMCLYFKCFCYIFW